jgi:hypothetical protein
MYGNKRMTINYVTILATNYPGAQWTLTGDTYDGITWLDDTPQPTQTELDAQWPAVEYANQYATVEAERLAAYEQTSDPIFFKWQRGDATEQQWLDAVNAVKNAHPYPPAP